MIAKPGVDLSARDPELAAADTVIDGVTRRVFGREAIVTSTRDGTHRPDSLHYEGLAEDLRVNDRPRELHERYADQLRRALRVLSPYFDVVYEADRHSDADIDTSHVHVELDVRRRARDQERAAALPEPRVDIGISIHPKPKEPTTMYIPVKLRQAIPDEGELRRLILETLRENLTETKADAFLDAVEREIRHSAAYAKIARRLPFWVPVSWVLARVFDVLDVLLPDVLLSALERHLRGV